LGSLNVSGNISAGNVAAAQGTFTNVQGTLLTASQTNITAVGTLGSLAVTGNITADNVSATKGTFSDIEGNLSTTSQTNITAVGTLGSLAVTGNITAGNVSAGRGTFSNISGTILTASQPNITTVGNLVSLIVTGNVLANNTVATGNVSANNLIVTSGITFLDGASQTAAAIGYGQTWQNVTSSRALGVTYTNTTGKPIQIFVSVNSDVIFTQFTVTIDSIGPFTWGRNAMGSGTNGYDSTSLIIPAGSTYSFSGGTLYRWLELR
jgi:hypothetical protein